MSLDNLSDSDGVTQSDPEHFFSLHLWTHFSTHLSLCCVPLHSQLSDSVGALVHRVDLLCQVVPHSVCLTETFTALSVCDKQVRQS